MCPALVRRGDGIDGTLLAEADGSPRGADGPEGAPGDAPGTGADGACTAGAHSDAATAAREDTALATSTDSAPAQPDAAMAPGPGLSRRNRTAEVRLRGEGRFDGRSWGGVAHRACADGAVMAGPIGPAPMAP